MLHLGALVPRAFLCAKGKRVRHAIPLRDFWPLGGRMPALLRAIQWLETAARAKGEKMERIALVSCETHQSRPGQRLLSLRLVRC